MQWVELASTVGNETVIQVDHSKKLTELLLVSRWESQLRLGRGQGEGRCLAH